MRYGQILLRTCLLALVLSAGCSKNLDDPLTPLAKKFDKYPEYTIILQDMEKQGVFFKSYHHLYKVIYGEKQAGGEKQADGEKQAGEEALLFHTRQTAWTEVSSSFFKKNEALLGMVILSKGGDGKVAAEAYPPGYQYVGNSNYGKWKTNSSGGSFWEFYGKYALFSTALGLVTRPLYRQDYDRYTDYRGRGAPYFGPSGNSYGTRGTYTKTTQPTFFERQQSRERSRNSSFSDKVRNRSQASSSRSRSSSRGGK